MYAVEQYVRECGLERRLLELVKLRASQINGCAYCVDMHTKDARSHGETEQRLYAVVVWREAPFFNLLPRANLEDNVALPLIYRGTPRAERLERAREMLEKVGLGQYGRSRPNQISGGQQQRVAIARALVNHPKLLLADEPTGNLDTHTSQEIMALFSELNQRDGITIVLITHEPDIAAYAQRLVRLSDGRIVYDGLVEHAAPEHLERTS